MSLPAANSFAVILVEVFRKRQPNRDEGVLGGPAYLLALKILQLEYEERKGPALLCDLARLQ